MRLSDKLKKNEEVEKQELINYVIGIQLEKIETNIIKYRQEPKYLIREDAENAMANLIELLKLKNNKKSVKVGRV